MLADSETRWPLDLALKGVSCACRRVLIKHLHAKSILSRLLLSPVITVYVGIVDPKRHLLREFDRLDRALAEWAKRRCIQPSQTIAARGWSLRDVRIRLLIRNRVLHPSIGDRPVLAIWRDRLDLTACLMATRCLLLPVWPLLSCLAIIGINFALYFLLALNDGLAGLTRSEAVIRVDLLDLPGIVVWRVRPNVHHGLRRDSILSIFVIFL